MGKSKEQVNAIKKCISSICKEQALAHRHAAESCRQFISTNRLSEFTDHHQGNKCNHETDSHTNGYHLTVTFQ